MNLEAILEIAPKRVKTKDGMVNLVARWSTSEEGWIVGYGINNTIKGRENCGRAPTLLGALLDLNKKMNEEKRS